MKTAFMTLGCPHWDLDTICRKGQEYGFGGVDFRGIQDQIDITQMSAFRTNVKETKKKLTNAGLAVSGISSSLKICAPERIEAHLDEAKRTIEVALALETKNIRVFGGGDLENASREVLAGYGRETMQKILALDGAQDLDWLFETHDLWIQSKDAQMLIEGVGEKCFGALWDIGHTSRVGEEPPQETFSAIGPNIRYVHIKDAIHDPSHEHAMQDGWRYVNPGEGQLPLAEGLRLLKTTNFDGWVLFEHEKRWHPELSEPEVAFPAFVKWFDSLGL